MDLNSDTEQLTRLSVSPMPLSDVEDHDDDVLDFGNYRSPKPRGTLVSPRPAGSVHPPTAFFVSGGNLAGGPSVDTEQLIRLSVSPMPLSDIDDHDDDDDVLDFGPYHNVATPSSPRPTKFRSRHKANESISSINMNDLPPVDDDFDFDGVPTTSTTPLPSPALPPSRGHPNHVSIADPIDPQTLHLEIRAARSRSASHKLMLRARSTSPSRAPRQPPEVAPPLPTPSFIPTIPPPASAPPTSPPPPPPSSSASTSSTNSIPTPVTPPPHHTSISPLEEKEDPYQYPEHAIPARAPSPDITTIISATPRPRRKSSTHFSAGDSSARSRSQSRVRVSKHPGKRRASDGVVSVGGGAVPATPGSKRGRASLPGFSSSDPSTNVHADEPWEEGESYVEDYGVPIPGRFGVVGASADMGLGLGPVKSRGGSVFGFGYGEENGGFGEDEGHGRGRERGGSDSDSSLDLHTPLP